MTNSLPTSIPPSVSLQDPGKRAQQEKKKKLYISQPPFQLDVVNAQNSDLLHFPLPA